MSDVSKTNAELIAMREAIMETLNDPVMALVFNRDMDAWAAGLAMKLAATRVPEQGEASVAIERVRALHQPVDIEPSETICGECSFRLPNGTYFGKVEEWPCPTLAALDGAPEPEVKP